MNPFYYEEKIIIWKPLRFKKSDQYRQNIWKDL
jgi:hypothetical protein